MDTTEKKIYFYRLFMKKSGNPVDSDLVFSRINSLSFSNGERYFELQNENAQCMYIEPICQPLRANIGTVRTKDLPMTEHMGVTDPLNLPNGVGLYESTHFVIFPNNVIGSEYNYYGPRIYSLKKYIQGKVPDLVDEVELVPLMRHDFMEQIRKIGEIKKFRLKVHRDMLLSRQKINANLRNTLEYSTKMANNIEEIDISLNSSDGINLSILDNLPEMIHDPDVLGNILALKIRAKNEETKKMETFDLLQEYILSVKQVIKRDELHRSVDKNSMYNAIELSYDELKPEIFGVIGKGK